MIALLANPLIRYAIVGAGALIVGFGLAWWLQQHRVEALQDRHRVAQENAERWEHAAQARERVIASLNAQIDKLVKDAAETASAALRLIDEAQERADTTERKLAQLRKQANEAPEADKPKALSPHARAGLDWLRCRSGGDPGAC